MVITRDLLRIIITSRMIGQKILEPLVIHNRKIGRGSSKIGGQYMVSWNRLSGPIGREIRGIANLLLFIKVALTRFFVGWFLALARLFVLGSSVSGRTLRSILTSFVGFLEKI